MHVHFVGKLIQIMPLVITINRTRNLKNIATKGLDYLWHVAYACMSEASFHTVNLARKKVNVKQFCNILDHESPSRKSNQTLKSIPSLGCYIVNIYNFS